ncbi:hypothetical protein D3C71_2012430 [compost metagenome]
MPCAALDAEVAVHQAHQLAGDDQAEAAADLAGGEEVAALQLGVEQGVALAGFYGPAAVLHGDAQAR